MSAERPRDKNAFFTASSQEMPPAWSSVCSKRAKYFAKELVPCWSVSSFRTARLTNSGLSYTF